MLSLFTESIPLVPTAISVQWITYAEMRSLKRETIMAKGSVRKKGKKWYYRFYVEDAIGNLVQKECAGTESKSETEKLLRQAMEDYEEKKFVAKADNITLGELLDIWAEEELKTGTLSMEQLVLIFRQSTA